MSARIIKVDTVTSRYNFDRLRHGDILEVSSQKGAQEMFRRWRRKTGRRARLIKSEVPDRVVFLEDSDIV